MEIPYPESPKSVPADLTTPSRSYRRHAWLAVLGLLAFFALYLGAIGWFGYKAVALTQFGFRSDSILAFAGAALATFFVVILAKGLIPTKREDTGQSVEIRREDEPLLMAFVDRVADEANAPRPHKVVLAGGVNAAVFYDLSLINLIIPTRKNLVIGLALVNSLTLAEFKAVLAHEFGHFAQKAMSVGRWVYIGREIATRIVARRDAVDKLLMAISRFDLRVAWVGWILQLIAWAVRSVTETFFTVVVAAERALSREMEFQADRVAVSLAGSDAIVHALFRLQAADTAWGHACAVGSQQLRKGKCVPDLFELHSQCLEHLRRVLGDDEFGAVPALPESGRASHRVFTPALAHPPVMWSTHPASHLREDNAKEPYVRAPLDDRSAWSVFSDPQRVRLEMTQSLLDIAGIPEGAESISSDEAAYAADERYDKSYLEPRYHGLYMGRAVTRAHASPADLYGTLPIGDSALRPVLSDAYPESLADLVRSERELREEKADLEALRAGVADAPGGVILHRGEAMRKRDLGDVVDRVEHEHRDARQALFEVDARLRGAHRAAARELDQRYGTDNGRSWEDLHVKQLFMLHVAEHAEADIDDAADHFSQVLQVVLADGKVTSSELTQVVHAADDLYRVLENISRSRDTLKLNTATAAFLEVESWEEAFGEPFGLLEPHESNIQDWVGVVDSWVSAYSGLMSGLGAAALESLLDVEAHIRRCYLDDVAPGPAPEPSHPVTTTRPFPDGSEREPLVKLRLWDRFMMADGWIPGAARLGVAGAIVGSVVFAGATLGSSTVVIYNSLNRPVEVTIGSESVGVSAHGRAELDLHDSGNVHVQTSTHDGSLIEEFDVDVDRQLAQYAYSVAGAAPLFEWVAVYGSTPEREPTMLGPERWLETDAEFVFEEPPESIESSSDSGSRTVLSALDARDTNELTMVAVSVDGPDLVSIATAHGMWDPLPLGAVWISSMDHVDHEAAMALLEERREREPGRVVLERLAQDLPGDPNRRAEVCDRHRREYEQDSGNGNAAYLALRCLDPGPERAEATFEAYQASPDNGWLQSLAAYSAFSEGRYDDAITLFEQARDSHPHMQPSWIGSEVRVMRLQDRAFSLESMARRSLPLQILAAHELGTAAEVGFGQAYLALQGQEFQRALDLAGELGIHDKILRMVAISSGADETHLREASALELPPEAGPDQAIAALLIAHRTGNDLEPARAVLRELFPYEWEVFEAMLAGPALLEDLAATEEMLRYTTPEARGYALMLGVLTCGERAPHPWYADATRLLFIAERAFMEEPVEQLEFDPDAPEDPEDETAP